MDQKKSELLEGVGEFHGLDVTIPCRTVSIRGHQKKSEILEVVGEFHPDRDLLQADFFGVHPRVSRRREPKRWLT